MRSQFALACPVILLIVSLSPARALANASCASLSTLKLADTSITSATAVSAGPFSVPGPPAARVAEAPVLPAFCRAVVQAGINQGKSLDQLKQEKVLAQWQYLETPLILAIVL